jgi:cytoskeletal protein CcmA (bactofilin family)
MRFFESLVPALDLALSHWMIGHAAQVVRKRLLIRATGRVSGAITYGEIEIERGGKISGAIQAYEDGAISSAGRAQRQKHSG